MIINDPDGLEDSSSTYKKPAANRKGLFIIIAVTIALIVFSRREPLQTIDCSADIIATKPDIIMLGAWWCSYCYQAKKYFQHNDIHYCEYDMENTKIGRQLYQQHGGGAIPKLLIGEYQLNGFEPRQVERALEILHEAAAGSDQVIQ